jgi:hypothetical protein
MTSSRRGASRRRGNALIALCATTAALGGGQALSPAPAWAVDDSGIWADCLARGGAPATGRNGEDVCVFADGSGGDGGVIRVFGVTPPQSSPADPPPPPCPAQSSCLPPRSPDSRDGGLEGKDRGSRAGEPKRIEKPETFAQRWERSGCELLRRRAARLRPEDDDKSGFWPKVGRWWWGSKRDLLAYYQRQWDGGGCDRYLSGGLRPH